MSRRTAGVRGGPVALVVGVGARRGVPASEVLELIAAARTAAGCAGEPVLALATVAARADEPGLTEAARRLGVPLRSFPAAALAAVAVPDPSAVVAAAAGTASVAEAAALLAAGPDAELLAGKRKSPAGRATCALALAAVTPHGALTAGREGAAAAVSPGADIVMTSPDPPHRGTERRRPVIDDKAPDGEDTGSKETP
ncbi:MULTISPECIES: cobalamin biosynthesis protein [Streptomyces]|uniref:Cobalamin biosynthesis protein n=1 Tax=Streptomyces siderophoricus TaxID=2802281 RepID=A0ABS1MN28_9ACTN|nr:cobalamin biosynthesis protein [Streptomyces sp. 9-7]MBL1089157.1 cobalamin biosynthesis protein [Streptomyces sp. 9-7]